MEMFSALLALCAVNSPVPGEFPSQRPVTRSLDVFFDMCLNKQLSKQLWGWWFETPSRSLWRHCQGLVKSGPQIWPQLTVCVFTIILLVCIIVKPWKICWTMGLNWYCVNEYSKTKQNTAVCTFNEIPMYSYRLMILQAYQWFLHQWEFKYQHWNSVLVIMHCFSYFCSFCTGYFAYFEMIVILHASPIVQ